jgi:hypothetical protein
VYLRLGRDEEKIVYAENPPFEIGRAILLREGDDIAFIASGPTFELRRHLGLSSAHIVEEARKLIRKEKKPLSRSHQGR